ncbi:MAG: hypothetical protein KDA87_12310, partial [Planctomycetales bacterium]|nr:hypothetical protein [Planctomycetales bacterium]
AEYTEVDESGQVVLSLDSALRLAYMHSPDYQQQLETVYLSALDVTTERFRLDTQFYGGNDTTFAHVGRLRPGGETNTLNTTTDFQMTRRFATAGELLVGFANSFVWQFAGPDTNSAFSILNFNLVQPLLRGAGRDRALETLTRAERGMLANLRQLERYRRGFYTRVAIGNLGVGQVSRLGGFQGGTGLTGFSGTGLGGLGGVGAATGFGGGFFGGGAGGTGAGGGTGLAGGGAGQVGGYIGLLQNLQEIRNTQYSLDLQLRTLALLEANLDAGTIDLTQVDQFRQNIETLRAQLLQARTGLDGSLDSFKTDTLGLPPDLAIKLQDEFIRPFQLIAPEITELQDQIAVYQDSLGLLPVAPSVNEFQGAITEANELLADYQTMFEQTDTDLRRLSDELDKRKEAMLPVEQKLFDRDLDQLAADYQKRPEIMAKLQSELDTLRDLGANTPAAERLRRLVRWTRQLSDETQSLSLIQARARLEAITVEPIELESSRAMQIARQNRMDYMNNRASLVDSYRLIAFNADQLQSVLNVRLNGDLRTVGDNPVEFRGPNGTLTASLEFDAPLTRLLERNNYRQALIDYQQSRRRLIQFDDTLNQSIRQQLRNLNQLATNLEIQRRAVIISIRRVDFTRAELNRPAAAADPGTTASAFGPTAVQNLLSALSDLSNAQNNFMSVWLNYYAGRMQLVRDLGLMQLDEQGNWLDLPLDQLVVEAEAAGCLELPPALPDEYWTLVDQLPADQAAAIASEPSAVETAISPEPTDIQANSPLLVPPEPSPSD